MIVCGVEAEGMILNTGKMTIRKERHENIKILLLLILNNKATKKNNNIIEMMA